MQRVEKQGESSHQNTHCFPAFEGGSGQSSEDCNTFRPLFQGQDSVSGKEPSAEGKDALAQIREKRFLEGIEAGKAEACNIVQKALETPIHQFLSQQDQYSDCFSQITDHYSDHIVELSIMIAKKILGDAAQPAEDIIQRIVRQVQDLLKGQYQLSVKFNGDDIESLNELLECVRPHWKASEALDFKADDETGTGNIQLDPSDGVVESLQDQFKQQVNQILSDR